MKNWILFILRINGKLGALAKREERCIEQYSQSAFSSTMAAYDEIFKHLDKKIRYINLRVMYNEFKKALSNEELETLTSYAKGEAATDIAERCGYTRPQVFRVLARYIKKCAVRLELLGYTPDRFEQEYSNLSTFGMKNLRSDNMMQQITNRDGGVC